MSWQLVAVLMIAEIVSNGMLSLPSSLAVVGIVLGVILIISLGVIVPCTSYQLVQFKLRHSEVHSMGDAAYILFGPIGREVLAFSTVAFAGFATGGQFTCWPDRAANTFGDQIVLDAVHWHFCASDIGALVSSNIGCALVDQHTVGTKHIGCWHGWDDWCGLPSCRRPSYRCREEHFVLHCIHQHHKSRFCLPWVNPSNRDRIDG